MKINNFIYHKNLYIFFIFLSLIIFFFSTEKLDAKAFNINNIEISKPFEINFNKNFKKEDVFDKAFKLAFNELILTLLTSIDKKKIQNINLFKILAISILVPTPSVLATI